MMYNRKNISSVIAVLDLMFDLLITRRGQFVGVKAIMFSCFPSNFSMDVLRVHPTSHER